MGFKFLDTPFIYSHFIFWNGIQNDKKLQVTRAPEERVHVVPFPKHPGISSQGDSSSPRGKSLTRGPIRRLIRKEQSQGKQQGKREGNKSV